LAKSEICDGVAVVCNAAGLTPPGGSGDMLPQEILKNEQKCDALKATV